MAQPPPETPKHTRPPRSAPSSSSQRVPSSPASSRRPRPALSPLSTVQGPSPSHSFRTPTYQSSVRPPESISGLSLAPSRLTRVLTGTASQAGSTATGAHAGSTKFRRGHVRKRPGQLAAPAGSAVSSANPDEVDLMALEEPDDVFRAFGVRDVRRIEQRASDAAAAKVAELRTMVGERYRDLLSAADSIVRMRGAADKLVDHLDAVGQAVTEAGAAAEGPSTKVGKAPQAPRRRTHSPSRQRTLGSSATLSLTIHLLLTIPSLVHSLLETSDFLPAARLEDLGRLIYRELSDFELPPQGAADGDAEEEDDGPRKLTDAFPIVDKQWETLSTLRPVVLRRALAELQVWDAPQLSTAQTLAATILLQEGTTISSALSTLLKARSRALSAILDSPSTSSRTGAGETSTVAHKLEQVLGLVLRTVEAVSAIFGSSDDDAPGLLRQLLAQVAHPSFESSPTPDPDQRPSAPAPSLPPVLATLPNYATLERHLPAHLLAHSPPLAATAAREPLDAPALRREVDAWLEGESDRVVRGVTRWIAALSTAPGAGAGAIASAKPLAALRATLRRVTASPSPPPAASASSAAAAAAAATTATLLRQRLERVIESRLAAVYRARLSVLSQRVAPLVDALLLALPDPRSGPDRDAAAFLFETPLAFPPAAAGAVPAAVGAGAGVKAGALDPFEAFLGRVGKRVEGRAPLVEEGLGELEDAARELRADLESWLGSAAEAGGVESEGGEAKVLRERLWSDYVEAAGEALDGVADALEGVVADVAQDIDGALFVGNFVFLLSSSRTFVRDLLLGAASSAEGPLLAQWRSRLEALQERTLIEWQKQAVALAVRKLQESMSTVAAAAPSATLWAWDASRGDAPPSPLVPSSPSSALLSSLRSLSASLARVGLHRTQASPSIASSLLVAFSSQVLDVAGGFADELARGELQQERRGEVACQAAWDLALLRRLAVKPEGAGQPRQVDDEQWCEVEGRLLRLVLPTSDSLRSQLDSSTLAYLQRTQSILAPLLAPSSTSTISPPANTDAPASSAPKHRRLSSTARLLPLGAPLASADVKATGLGLVKPGPRLGLLPTRG
ncbi:Vps51/Vps67 domain-containing protein [Rhodotorula diobovata]|uniref:Conserved oligomeric Golgi complex subunit 1 n=1 Tax=Rhodotorula diobovata TaxID=5288 RepID=A0A5C5FSI5_9BASI|nr:Vps51/Vps67 domain-containing protein [Rhodotorula diobovata]